MALQVAIANIARAGNTRSGYATRTQIARSAGMVTFTINGTDRTRLVNRYESEIHDVLNETPNTASLVVRGFTPTVGMTVVITRNLDNAILFAGLVQTITHLRRRTGTRVRYRLDCIDWTFLLDRRLVSTNYSTQSASSIAAALLAAYTSGFTTGNIEPSLSSTDLQNTMELPTRALTRLANLVGAFWYIDYEKDLHFRSVENLTTPATLDTTNATFKKLGYTKDLSQIRTRVLVEGLGTTTTAAVAVGATSLTVSDSSPFSGSGGTARSGSNIFTYTGVGTASGASVLSAARPAPSSACTLSSVAGVGSHTAETFALYVSFIYSDGVESLPSAVSNTTVSSTTNVWSAASIPVGDSRVTARRLYISENGAAPVRYDKIADNTTTTWVSENGTGGEHNAFGSTVGALPVTAGSYAAGSTFLYVSDSTNFSGSGGTALSGLQTFTYTGRSAASGIAALTGIPAAGAGAITGTIAIADTVAPSVGGAATLTGIPASGASSIQYVIKTGDDVNILVTVNDTTAQTALAALEGGDGIHEHYIQDRRLSIAGATARGTAELTLGKDPDETVTFTSEDWNCQSGRSVTVNVASISVTVKIQQVRIYWKPGRWLPQRDATATNRFKDFYQYVRDLEDKTTRATT